MVACGARPRRSCPGYISFTAQKPCAMTTAGQLAVISPGESGPPGGCRSRRRSCSGVMEPDPDRGHVDGSASDEVAFVVPGRDGAVLAELAEGPLDDVALLVRGSVEGGRPSTFAAAPDPVAGLVRGLGNRGLDPAPGAGERGSRCWSRPYRPAS